MSADLCSKAIKKMTELRIEKANKIVKEQVKKGEKFCRHCEKARPLSEFRKFLGTTGKERYESWCKECGVVLRRDRRQQEHYHLTPEDSAAIVAYQKRQCAICKSPMELFKRALATDHDHKTGLIRGKLCWFCNKLIAIAQDNPTRLLFAALYLIHPPAVAALGEPRFGLPGRAGTKKQRKLAKKLAKNPVHHTFTPLDPVRWLSEWIHELGKSENDTIPSVV